jgi:hypothetical protein
MQARLENWSVTRKGDIYLAPEHHTTHLQGEVFDHDAHEDGKRVTSSPIVASEGQEATTYSGTRYVLGQPCPRWLAWMDEEGIEFDPENPIQLIKDE